MVIGESGFHGVLLGVYRSVFWRSVIKIRPGGLGFARRALSRPRRHCPEKYYKDTLVQAHSLFQGSCWNRGRAPEVSVGHHRRPRRPSEQQQYRHPTERIRQQSGRGRPRASFHPPSRRIISGPSGHVFSWPVSSRARQSQADAERVSLSPRPSWPNLAGGKPDRQTLAAGFARRARTSPLADGGVLGGPDRFAGRLRGRCAASGLRPAYATEGDVRMTLFVKARGGDPAGPAPSAGARCRRSTRDLPSICPDVRTT